MDIIKNSNAGVIELISAMYKKTPIISNRGFHRIIFYFPDYDNVLIHRYHDLMIPDPFHCVPEVFPGSYPHN